MFFTSGFESAPAIARTVVVLGPCTDVTERTIASIDQVTGDRRRRVLARIAHRHVDRLWREIPGLHDGNPGGEKAPAALLGVRHAS
jgi:hypothetical protein